jgi:hypothetical protein
MARQLRTATPFAPGVDVGTDMTERSRCSDVHDRRTPLRRHRAPARVAIAAAMATASCSGDVSLPVVPAVPGTWFVAPGGDDAGPGSLARPWRTLARALSAATAGATIVLRGGIYTERNLHLLAVGPGSAATTLRAMSGETAVVDGALPLFRDSPAQAWTLVDGARGIYRSTQALAGAGRIYGALPDSAGGFALVPYTDYAALAADREDYSDQQPYYCGPGVHWSPGDAHVYVRLQHGRYDGRCGFAMAFDTDATRVSLALWPAGTVLRVDAGSRHVCLEGITVRGAESAVEIARGCDDVTLRSCTLRGGRYAVLARGDATAFRFESLQCDGGMPPWVARSDVKANGTAAPAHFLQGSALQLEGAIDGVEVARCTFLRLFDGIDTNGAPTRLEIHHCMFATIRDDAFELASAGHHVDFHDNLVMAAAAGVSWNGSVAPPRAAAGTKYVHDNVLDTSTPMLYGRDDPQGRLPPAWRGPAGDGMATGRPFDDHDTENLDGPDPWKIYRNTIIGGVDVDGVGLGVAYRFAPFDPALPHEVLDNVLVLVGDQPAARFVHIDDGAQLFDGNLWFRRGAAVTTPLLEVIDSGVTTTFLRLDLFVAALRARTFAHYAPGWEAAGVEGDPQLRDDYHPAPGGPADGDGVDLAGRPWPAATAGNRRGAFDPW